MNKTTSIILLICFGVLAFSCSRTRETPEKIFKESSLKLVQDSVGEAFILAQKALKGFRDEGDKVGEDRAHVAIAMLYYITGQDREAINELKDIHTDLMQAGDTVALQNLLRLRGYYAAASGERNKALAYNDSLIAVDRLFSNGLSLTLDRLNKAEILINSNETQWARSLLDSISPSEERNPVIQPILHTRRAQLAFHEHDFDSARSHASRALLTEHPEATDVESRLMARSILMAIDSINGNLSGYANNRNLLQQAEDQVRSEKVRSHLAILKATETVERYRLENEYKDRMTFYVILLSLLIVALIIVVAVYKYKSILTKHKMVKLTCDSLDVEVFRYKMKNDLLSEKVKSLNDRIADARDHIMRLQAESSAAADSSGLSYLDCLKKIIDDSYGETMRRVKEKYPALTPNELLLIGFVKMGLTTSEMIRALSIEPRSLIKARYRLRKKLGIENSDELNNFIREL